VALIFMLLYLYMERSKQECNVYKKRLLADAASDFRMSISSIKAHIEELTKEQSLSDSGKKYLSMARDQANRLSASINKFKDDIPYKDFSEMDDVSSVCRLMSENMKAVVNLDEQAVSKMCLLLIEDDEENRILMHDSLHAAFDILFAGDGVEAWKIIQEQMPDLVLLDIKMPQIKSFEFYNLMKSTDETAEIPLIVLTQISDTHERLHVLGFGADYSLNKPIDSAKLLELMRSIFRTRASISNKKTYTKWHNDKFVKTMLDVVRINLANTNFGKDDFASAMSISASSLYKKVKLLTDLSPTDFIKVVRLNHAMELLHSRKHSVTEVSELCGFSSIGYFSTVFKKHFGKCPNEI